MLSFVPGDVPRNPLPPETAGDEVLVALARLIRTLHEASAGWAPPPDAVWGGTRATVGRPVAEQAELVSHCDFRSSGAGKTWARSAGRLGVSADQPSRSGGDEDSPKLRMLPEI